jgi:outer membrane protein OmpA-like peptidoglycan-associated protein
MNKWLLPVFGLLALGALTYLCGNHHGPMIEADLTGKTNQALTTANLTGPKVSAEGQIITLKGFVPSLADKQKAGELAASVYGVSEVRNLLEVSTPPAKPTYVVPDRAAALNCQDKFNSLLKENIRYTTGSSTIHAASFKLLNQLAAATGLCPGAIIEVGGYTDNVGSPQYNQALSERRAKLVVAFLESKGVDGKRLIAAGYGEASPIAENKTPAGRSRNRRTEFKVKGL